MPGPQNIWLKKLLPQPPKSSDLQKKFGHQLRECEIAGVLHKYTLFHKHTSYLKSTAGVRDCGNTSCIPTFSIYTDSVILVI